MSDAQVVAMAVAAFAGALVPSTTPLMTGGLLAVVALALQRPWLIVLAAALLASSLAARSWDGIDAPRPAHIDGSGTVVTDPERFGRGTTLVVRVDGTRYLATGWGGVGARLGRTEAGELIRVTGTTRPYGGPAERKAALHLGHRLSVESANAEGDGNLLWQTANGLRGRLVEGARSLDPQRRALFTGLVYGDDRHQDPLTASDFRLAGLTHLLAVSGQNVAYVLTLARPIIQRFSLRGRWAVTLGVLVVFAAATRFEASVLRATVMAGIAVTGNLLGREANSGRLLALAVTGLLLVDPLLAHTVAFRLSVAASAGIVWLKPVVQPQGLRPGWLAEAVGVTVAAQLAVAPLLITTFGPVSVVSLPANVVAGPIAGLVMAWGMTAGLVAGFVPAGAAWLVHRPTALLLWLLEAVGFWAGRIPLAPVGLGWIGATVFLLLLRPFWAANAMAKLAVLVSASVLALTLVPDPVEGGHAVGRGSEVWVVGDQTVLVLAGSGPVEWLLDDLRAVQVRHIDLVVMSDDHGVLIDQLNERISVAKRQLLPEGSSTVSIGSKALVVTVTSGELDVALRG